MPTVDGTILDDLIALGYTDGDGDMVTDNADEILGYSGNDTIDGAGGNDTIDGGTGNDSIFGGLGADSIQGGNDDDTLHGDGGADTIVGGDGQDNLVGGNGFDDLIGGAGADSMSGGADRDDFIIEQRVHAYGDTIDGGTTGNDVDKLDLRGLGKFEVVNETVDADLDSTSGQVNFLDADDNIEGTLIFREIERLLVCFAPGTAISTPGGDRRVEDLRIGDWIVTSAAKPISVKWIGRQTVRTSRAGPKVQPVRIRSGALGDGLPHSDLIVTADHGMVVDGLVINASALVNGHSIDWVPMDELPTRVTYYHIETEDHDVILANGAAAETFVDYVGRREFDNYQEYLNLYGADRIIREMSCPRVSAARLVPDQIRRRLGISARRAPAWAAA